MKINACSLLFSLITLVFAAGCFSDDPKADRVAWAFNNDFKFHVDASALTPKGIAVDTDGQDVNLETIDEQVDEIEECLLQNFPDGKTIDIIGGTCEFGDFDPHIDRSSFNVLVTKDYSLSCDGSQQVLNVKAPQRGCDAKGLTANPDCPCRWRNGFQADPSPTAVVTPSLYMIKDAVTRYVTGCLNPWGDKVLSTCVHPTLPPLPAE